MSLYNQIVCYGPKEHQITNVPLPSAFWMMLKRLGFPIKFSLSYELATTIPKFDIYGTIGFCLFGKLFNRRVKYCKKRDRWVHYWIIRKLDRDTR